MTDFQAKKYRITAYKGDTDDPLDLSRAIKSAWNIRKSSLDTNGWVGFICEIIIHAHPSIEELDTRLNPLRWCRGNRVVIEVLGANGWIKVKTLRMLDSFYRQKDRVIRLKLGDKYLLKNARRPPGDSSPVQLSTGITVGDWANANLVFFGLPQLAQGLGDPALSELISGSMPYQGGGNILDHIGQGIWANTGAYLYLDAEERSRVERLNLAPTVAAFVGAARDCEPYERGDGENETPAGRVRVLGNPQYVFANPDPQDLTTTSTVGVLTRTETIAQSTSGNTITTTTTGTETVTGISANTGAGGNLAIGGPYKTTHTKNYAGGTNPIPNPDPDLPSTPGSPPWLVSEQIKTEQTPEFPPVQGGGGGSFGLRTAKQQDIAYDYYSVGADGQPSYTVREIVDTTKRNPDFEATSGGGSGGGSGGSILDTDLVDTQTWDRVPNGYRYRRVTVDPIAEQSDRRKSVTTSSPGSSEPLGTQFKPSPYGVKTLEILQIERFAYPVGAPDNDHPRDYNLGQYIQSKPAAKARAKELGALLIGRHEVQHIGFKPSDAYLGDWRPCQVAFVHRNATIDDVYLIDGDVLMFDDRRTYIATEGVWLGVRDRTTGTITPPYQIPTTTQSYLKTTSGYLLNATGGKIIIGG